MADIFPEVGQVVLTSLLSLAAMFIFTRARAASGRLRR